MTVSQEIYNALIPVEKAKPDLPEEWESVGAEKYRQSQEVLGFDFKNTDFLIVTYMEVKLGPEQYNGFMDKIGNLVEITHWLPLYEKEQ